jgi:hypothetical protein
LIRALSATVLTIRDPYVVRLPLYNKPFSDSELIIIESMVLVCTILKKLITKNEITEQSFINISQTDYKNSIFSNNAALLHLIEGCIERNVIINYDLGSDEIRIITDETGTPAGWFSLIQGYDPLPPLPDGLPKIPQEVLEFFSQHRTGLSHFHATFDNEFIT